MKIGVKFVELIDWNGKLGTYRVIRTKKDRRYKGKVSVTFFNSMGDIEKAVVNPNQIVDKS